MAMFMPNNKAVFATAVVLVAHIGLLSLMLGQAPESINTPTQISVIQGILVAATPPPPPKPKPKPEPPKKVTAKPEPKPLTQKIKTEEAPAVIEEPPEEIIEPIETEIEPPPEEPMLQPAETPPEVAKVTEVIPPRVDAYQHNNPAPRYPKLSKRLREEGTVLLQLLINKNGTVSDVEIKTSSGYPRLDQAAIKAVKRWRYTPASQGNNTIAYRYEQPVHFAMN